MLTDSRGPEISQRYNVDNEFPATASLSRITFRAQARGLNFDDNS